MAARSDADTAARRALEAAELTQDASDRAVVAATEALRLELRALGMVLHYAHDDG